MSKLEEIVKALVALTRAVPGCHTVCTMCASSDFVRLSVGTDEAFASLSAAFGARIELVDYGDNEWDVGIVSVGDVRVEVSGPHRPRRVLPDPTPVDLAGADDALAQADGALS